MTWVFNFWKQNAELWMFVCKNTTVLNVKRFHWFTDVLESQTGLVCHTPSEVCMESRNWAGWKVVFVCESALRAHTDCVGLYLWICFPGLDHWEVVMHGLHWTCSTVVWQLCSLLCNIRMQWVWFLLQQFFSIQRFRVLYKQAGSNKKQADCKSFLSQ